MTVVCRVCERELTDPTSRALGIGPVCERNNRPQPTGIAPQQLTLETLVPDLPEVRLTCISPEAAAAVVAEHADYFGAGPSNTVRQDGTSVVIRYFDKRWPLDIADWAGEQGHATDHDAAAVIAQL